MVHPLKVYLVKKGIRQKVFASTLGVGEVWLSNLITFTAHPSRELAKKIADATQGEVTEMMLLYPEHFQDAENL